MATNILGTIGSASGIDTGKLVTDLVAAQKAPQQGRIDTKTEQYEAKLSAYGILKSSLAEFQNAMAPLADPAVFNAKAINVPTTDVVSFNSLSAEAPAGNYQLDVSQIAATQSLAINSSQVDANAALNKTGKLTFNTGQWTYDGANAPDAFTANADKPSFDIDVTADDSLATIAQKINDADSDIQAAVINIDGQFQLLITAESGAENALQITADPSATGLVDFEFKDASTTVVETQQGANAKFTLNGLEIERGGNTIDDVIVGLDFTLNKQDAGNSISFSIAQDKGAAETAINGFIDAYNLLQATIKPLVGVGQDENNNLVRGDLSRDGAAKNLASLITQTMSSTVQGLKVTDAYSSLGAIGVNTNTDGTLEIDSEQFNLVIQNDFDKLAGLFGVNTTSSSNFVELNTGSFAAQATAGEYAVNITAAPTKGSIVGDAVSSFDMSSGVDFIISVNGVDSNSISLIDNYASLDALAADMQAQINGDMLLKAGFAGVSVTVESGALKITSNDFGSSSNVSFTADISSNFSTKLGLSDSTVGTNGVDVAGTINGEATLGSGNIMLPAIGSAAYGLNLSFKEGTPPVDYTVNFTRGLAGDLSLLVSAALASSGQIASSESSIADAKDVLTVDQENLDRKMSAYQERLSSQYTAMERIVASLNQTSSQLDGLIDRLPFTAQN